MSGMCVQTCKELNDVTWLKTLMKTKIWHILTVLKISGKTAQKYSVISQIYNYPYDASESPGNYVDT